MNQEEQRTHRILNQNDAMIELIEEQNKSYGLVTVCDTCKKRSAQSDPRQNITVTLLSDISVRSVSHAIYSCNVEHGSMSFFVLRFFHNSTAYDSHLIMEHLHKKQSKITVIPSNTEHFIGFQIDRIHYLDSYKFLSSSSDDLVKNLHNNGVDRFKYM